MSSRKAAHMYSPCRESRTCPIQNFSSSSIGTLQTEIRVRARASNHVCRAHRMTSRHLQHSQSATAATPSANKDRGRIGFRKICALYTWQCKLLMFNAPPKLEKCWQAAKSRMVRVKARNHTFNRIRWKTHMRMSNDALPLQQYQHAAREKVEVRAWYQVLD